MVMMTMGDLSEDQEAALDRIGSWFAEVEGGVRHCDDESCAPYAHTHGDGTGAGPILALGGCAGTGKTTVMRWLEARLACRVSFAVPTHKAARVLRGKLDEGARERVSTFHSLAYYPNARHICGVTQRTVRPVNAGGCGHPEGSCECPVAFEPCGAGRAHDCLVVEQLRWEDRPHLATHFDLLVVDESSMVSEEDAERLRAFGVPILLVGDHGQLPPVQARMNRWTLNPDASLTVNHRQASDTSGIVDVALAYRRGEVPALGRYGDGRAALVPRSGDGVSALLTPERYRDAGVERPAIICPWNRLRANVNRRFHGDGPVRPGDAVVALSRCLAPLVRNPVDPGAVGVGSLDLGDAVPVHGGQVGTVLAVVTTRRLTADLVIAVEDVGAVLVANVALSQFGRATTLALNERPVGSRLWDYAYAITAHKAQGSEWDNVLVLEESPQDRARWMYTAVTRARKRLIVARY